MATQKTRTLKLTRKSSAPTVTEHEVGWPGPFNTSTHTQIVGGVADFLLSLPGDSNADARAHLVGTEPEDLINVKVDWLHGVKAVEGCCYCRCRRLSRRRVLASTCKTPGSATLSLKVGLKAAGSLRSSAVEMGCAPPESQSAMSTWNPPLDLLTSDEAAEPLHATCPSRPLAMWEGCQSRGEKLRRKTSLTLGHALEGETPSDRCMSAFPTPPTDLYTQASVVPERDFDGPKTELGVHQERWQAFDEGTGMSLP